MERNKSSQSYRGKGHCTKWVKENLVVVLVVVLEVGVEIVVVMLVVAVVDLILVLLLLEQDGETDR